MRRFDCSDPRQNLAKLLHESSHGKPYNCDFRLISFAANLYYFVRVYFCLVFSLLTRLAKLFSLLGHAVSVIMFFDMALSLSRCFDLSVRCNSFRFKSGQISFY